MMSSVYSQNNASFCKAVGKNNFNKVERLVKKEIRKKRSGTQYDNGQGSGIQVTHVYDLDTITSWLKRFPCVEDAFWDKCQVKISIYPGWSVIGVRLNTESGPSEKCFHIQEGTTGSISIFGWRPHLFKYRNKLIYKKMCDCEGFIEQQKNNCNTQQP